MCCCTISPPTAFHTIIPHAYTYNHIKYLPNSHSNPHATQFFTFGYLARFPRFELLYYNTNPHGKGMDKRPWTWFIPAFFFQLFDSTKNPRGNLVDKRPCVNISSVMYVYISLYNYIYIYIYFILLVQGKISNIK